MRVRRHVRECIGASQFRLEPKTQARPTTVGPFENRDGAQGKGQGEGRPGEGSDEAQNCREGQSCSGPRRPEQRARAA
eukprot:3787585-Alexandrium_andersonii.AAC.1